MKSSLCFINSPKHGKLLVTQSSEGLVVRYFLNTDEPEIKIIEDHFFSEFANKSELKNFLNSINF